MPGPADISAQHSESHRAEMIDLVSGFYPDLSLLGALTPIAASELQPSYQSLLAHDDHMTVTLEAFHESLVVVQVEAEIATPDSYARKSVLTRQSDGTPVQSGVMRIDLPGLPATVREQIEQHRAPLGRILIRHNLLREVELLALWRVEPGQELRRLLWLETGIVIYGRSARILVEGRPVVELLEIVSANTN